MATQTHNSPTSVTYARSLLELAQEREVLPSVAEDLSGITEVLEANPNFVSFLRDPSIGSEERSRVIDNVFKAHISPLLFNFLGVLNLHGRLGLLPQIAHTFADLLDEMFGKI